MGVFSEWITKDVLNVLKENNIFLVGSFQTSASLLTFDLTVNGKFEIVMQKQFCEWHSKYILHCLQMNLKWGYKG